jgi:peroxin-5
VCAARLHLCVIHSLSSPHADAPALPHPHTLSPPPPSFKRGLLSEAALALEAVVAADPGAAEVWRLLGTVHAENDDDKQAIAALGE